ncbi:MAG: phosphomannomutase/phosphoglucomutase [Actinobacteria bacterium]|nr:phosphomannomutase/phosphoglucomutase [Actinomycetota bacterium]
MDLGGIFKAYDIRGTYPEQFDEVAAHRIGAAFARWTGAKRIVVARDMRVSSEPLAKAFIEGVTGHGADAVDIGLVSTDALYFASGRHEIPGAMFTASHNPGHYNGIKLCLAGAAPVGQDTGLADIRRIAEEGVDPADSTGAVGQRDVLNDFVEHLLTFIDPSVLRPLKVVVDAANGMAGKMVPPVFERIPVELVPLYFELDGTFPNHPADPIQLENLTALRKSVIDEGADVGLAFDGDADRVFLVDETADPVSGSLTTALVAAMVMDKEPGATIIHNLICSRVVPETIAEKGGTAIRSRVGHSFIKKVMAETGAAFGGEHSGHYFFRDNFRADSGLICALFVLEAISREGRPFSEVLAPYRRYWNSGEINTEVLDQDAKMKELADAYSDGEHDWLDGLTVNYREWWFNVRPSNTEPLLRLNLEASDEAFGKTKTEEIIEVIRRN